MNLQIHKKLLKITDKKIIFIIITAFIILMIATTAFVTYKILSYDKIYKGIYVSNINIQSMSSDDLRNLLQKKFQSKIKDMKITLKCKDNVQEISLSDLNTAYDIENTVNDAYNIGRSGNILQRLHEIYQSGRYGYNLPLSVSFNEIRLKNEINSLYNKTVIEVKEHELIIGSDTVKIWSGHHGEKIDAEQVYQDVKSMINAFKDGDIDVPVIVTYPGKIDTDEYLDRINIDVSNATVKVDNNNMTVVPQVIGRNIDKASLEAIANELDLLEDTEKILPVTFTIPEITVDNINSKLFRDTLYTASTVFLTNTQNNKNRGNNIRLAVSRINGTIIGPGQVFSFNKIVGKRTQSGGYKIAHTYVAGKVVDGIGGGICQVSTTLYNAVLFSDLKVLERKNHMFIVRYVPLGRDAAVSYGSVDLKFKNNTGMPIRINGWVTKYNRIYFSIKGTNENTGKKIVISSYTMKTIDFKTKYINDPNLKKGKKVFIQSGTNGYVIDTYKTVKQDDKVISKVKIHTSRYNPLTQEVKIGTKVTPASSKKERKPSVRQGIDDADNPPAAEKPAE